MSHLLRPAGGDENSCDICGNNTKKHKIHDREKCVSLHDDARVLEEVNKGLKIAKSAVGSGGNAAIQGVTAGRMAFTKFGKTPRAGGKTTAKVGAKTSIGITAAAGALTLVDGILTIIDTATSKSPQERCSNCSRTLASPGCIKYCTSCESRCINMDWRKGSSDGRCCYHICDGCFGQLVGT